MEDSFCSNCGADHNGFEVEYCECGQHCEMCVFLCDECGGCDESCDCREAV